MTDERPRLTQRTLPPYSYVPGHAPHPVSDPVGHMYGEEHGAAAPLDPDEWSNSEEYLYGCDLLNHGFYWEAHESWEALWHSAGRQGEIADFLKGLIKLAAAAVKAREGNPRGVSRHASRALELLNGVHRPEFCGLQLKPLRMHAESLREAADCYDRPQPERLLNLMILPSPD